MLLAGDVGGTKTQLAIIDPARGARDPVHRGTLPSGRYPTLEALLHDYLEDAGVSIDSASFGVAGPVVNGRATITNLPWMIDERRLAEALHVPNVAILNDLAAIATAVPHLEPDDLHTINAGRPVEGGAMAVIAPGTGLGEAFLTVEEGRFIPHPCEGGHSDFGPTDELQIDMLRYLLARFGHVSYERVCSGMGLPNIYAFLRDRRFAGGEPEWLARALQEASDPTPIIVQAATDPERGSELCVATLSIFVSILGAEAGNLALKVLATGGVYLGGGIPPRILSVLEDGRFMQAFLDKGRFADMLRNIPVHVILHPEVALYGAASFGLGMANAAAGRE